MTPTSIQRTKVAIIRLQNENALKSRESFMANAQRRLDSGLDPYTINKDISALKHYLRFTHQEWKRIDYKKTTVKNVISPTREQIETFLAIETTPAFNFYWQLQAFCGTRPGEVINLRLQDIDLERECFYPQKTKTNDHKPIIIPHRLIKQLKAYIETLPKRRHTSYLFPSSDKPGYPLTIKAVEKDCQKRLDIMHCSLHWTPHTFRHAFITIGFCAGMPTHYVQKAVRHTKITTTEAYADKSIDYARQAVAIHPYYQEDYQKPEQIVDAIVKYINNKLDDRFNKALVNQAYSLLYKSCQIGS